MLLSVLLHVLYLSKVFTHFKNALHVSKFLFGTYASNKTMLQGASVCKIYIEAGGKRVVGRQY